MPKFFVTEDDARALGMTHEVRLWGIPGWAVTNADNHDQMAFVPKFGPLVVVSIVLDKLYDFATYFMSEDNWLDIPYVEIRKL